MTPPDKVFDSALHWLKAGRVDQALPQFVDALSGYEAMPPTDEAPGRVCRCRYLAATAAAAIGRDAQAEALLRAAVQVAPSVADATTRAAAYFAYGEFLVHR